MGLFFDYEDTPINDGNSYLSDDFILHKGEWKIELTDKSKYLLKIDCDMTIKEICHQMRTDLKIFSVTKNKEPLIMTDWEIKNPSTEKHDAINHPPHYNNSPAHCVCGRRIECIDITRHMSFNLGNVVKYIWRYEHKDGLEALLKARWYLKDAIENYPQEQREET
jgi:hypothetical protein